MFNDIITFWKQNIPVDTEYEERSGFNPVKMRHQRLVQSLHRQVELDEEQIKKWGQALKESVMSATAQQESRMAMASDRLDDAQACFLSDSEIFERACAEYADEWGEDFTPWKPQDRVGISQQAALARLVQANIITLAEAEARGYQHQSTGTSVTPKASNEVLERAEAEENGESYEASRQLTNA